MNEDEKYSLYLKEKYPRLSTSILMKYQIIQKIADDNRWTISDKKKRPVDAKHLLETYEVRHARIYDEPYPLVSLHELNADENLAETNRAYRLQAQHNNIIVIDIEPKASKELREFAMDFPAHLTEISTNGGVHLFIEIPEKAITPENKYLLESTVIKSPDDTFEIIANDHYITFTKKFVLDKPAADYHNNLEHFDRLQNFLNNIVEMDKEAQEERELKKQIAIDFDDSDLNTDLIEKLMESKSFVNFMERQSEKTPMDFNNDLSRYEGSVATACSGHVYRFASSLDNTQVLKHTFADMTENDWIYTAYLMTKHIVPEREKHTEIRDGLPWLLYNAQSGWTFIRAKEENKKE